MPTYSYECPACHERRDAFRHIDARHIGPFCIHGRMELRIVPTAVKIFRPYLTAAVDREQGERIFIRNRDEHEAFLRRNGYEEVGNDKSMAPISDEEAAHNRQRHKGDAAAAQFEWTEEVNP